MWCGRKSNVGSILAGLDGAVTGVIRSFGTNTAIVFKMRMGPSFGGRTAEAVVVDLVYDGTIDTSTWLTRTKGTAAVWHGRRVRARVWTTIVRGRTVFADGALVGPRGWGRLVRPSG